MRALPNTTLVSEEAAAPELPPSNNVVSLHPPSGSEILNTVAERLDKDYDRYLESLPEEVKEHLDYIRRTEGQIESTCNMFGRSGRRIYFRSLARAETGDYTSA